VAYKTATVAAGTQCPFGGVRVDTGIDQNGSGALDANEVTGSEYVCNGAPGSLVDVTPVSAGVACAAGGLRVRTGRDANSNGTLDAAEVTQTEYVCNGLVGAGSNMLVRAATVPPGAECPNGGYLIQAGIDDVTPDGQLQAAEVDASSYVCNGTTAPGSVGTLVDVATEAPGSNCPQGGVKISVGLDGDGNGTLSPSEVANTKFVCNAAPGPAGVASLVRLTPVAAGAQCAAGGFRIDTGTDDDKNGTLSDAEVRQTQLVCNGTAVTPLVRVVPEPAGAHCASGGVVVQAGVDLDANHVLDANEVDSSEYLCNAAGGTGSPAIVPVPIVVAPNGLARFSGTLDTSDLRLPDGTRADFYSVSMGSGGILDLSATPAGALEFHVFTNACLASSDLGTWSSCFVGAAPRQRVPAGQYVVMVKGTETAYLWGTTPYEATLRRSLDGTVPAMTLAEHVAAGLTSFESGMSTADTDDFLKAFDHWSTAASLIPTDGSATAADKNRARFFGALARVLVLARPYSDLVSNNGLNDFGDILDGFGLGGTPFQRSNLETLDMTAYSLKEECGWRLYYNGYSYYQQWECTWAVRKDLKPFSPDSPRGQDLQEFLASHVKAGLDGALTLLNAIDDLAVQLHSPGGKVTEIDLTDAVLVKAIANGMAAWIEVQRAYDLDLDIDEFRTNVEVRDKDGNQTYLPGPALSEYPFFGRLISAASLPGARTYAIEAVKAYRDALAKLGAETDDQSDDLFTMTDQTCTCVPSGPSCYMSCTTIYNPAQKLADEDHNASLVQGLLEASGNYTFDRGTVDTSDDITVNPSVFFAGVDLRSFIPTTFNAGRRDRPGMLPDPTFGGILVSSPLDLTADKDGDGSPDFFDGNYSWFFPNLLLGTTWSGWDWSFGANLLLSFPPGGNSFSMTADGGITSSSGTWAIDSTSKNVLVLTFDTTGPAGEKTMLIDADRIADRNIEAWSRRRDALGNGMMGDVQSNWSRQ
jgi:hypothetical protein